MFGIRYLLKKIFPSAILDGEEFDRIMQLQNTQKQLQKDVQKSLHAQILELTKDLPVDQIKTFTTTTVFTPEQYQKFLKEHPDIHTTKTSTSATTFLSLDELVDWGFVKPGDKIYKQMKKMSQESAHTSNQDTLNIDDQETFHPF